MFSVKVGSTSPVRGLRTSVALLCLGFASLVAQPVQTQTTQPPDALQFFKNYFVTGDYVVGGVGLKGKGVNGFATGTIRIGQKLKGLEWVADPDKDVPEGADVVAAFLYWQVVTTATAGPDSGSLEVKFRGHPLSDDGPFGKLLSTAGTAPCWASGGSTGSSGGSKKTYTYRADVLRYFEFDGATGKLAVNGAHEVVVPDSGSGGNSTPLALGASLVVIYRDPNPLTPLNAIVLYDGGYTLNNANPTMSQVIKGFYESKNGTGRLTHIVGSGQENKSETLLFNGTPIPGSSFGASAGPSWDNPTFDVIFDQGLTEVTTGVNPASDCLTWGAVIFKTEVHDFDGDGLLDIWESSPTTLFDPNDQPLPNLKDMGANPTEKDLFIEIGYMKADVETSYGGVPKPAHSHLPSPAALRLIGDAFGKDAPAGRKINVHFDVGDPVAYRSIPGYSSNEADMYIIGTGLARGGEAINEIRMPGDTENPTAQTAQECTYNPGTDSPWRCQFSDYPGTVGWKTGFRFFRDQVIGGEPAPSADAVDPCDAPGNDGPGQPCERRFDRNRKAMFHYALFAHAVGLPKSELPCMSSALPDAVPVADVNGRCAVVVNPLFRTPRTVTGVGDFPGGDVMVTLGGFSDHDGRPVGTPFMQASTLMHELGHNMERRHGGEALEPNCKPTYLSVMNYLYQLRGLLDDTGKPNLDLSRATMLPASLNEAYLSEAYLSDGTSISGWWTEQLPPKYRIGWYAPLWKDLNGDGLLDPGEGSYFAYTDPKDPTKILSRTTVAGKHCDGSLMSSTEPFMVRIDARKAESAIDWNANGRYDARYTYDLDINFSGPGGGPDSLRGSDDWSNLRLNQIGIRRAIGGLFVDRTQTLALGPLSLDSGRSDYGRSDYGRSDYGRSDYGRSDYGSEQGRSDYGRSDYGRSDYGRSDYGRSDYGRGDDGRGDFGGGDLFLGDPSSPGGELDAETAGDLARTPPNEFGACVIGEGTCLGEDSQFHQVRLTWTAPNVGGVSRYVVYRVAGETLVPDTLATPWTEVGQVPVVSGQVAYSLVDEAQLLNEARYTYFAVAEYADGIKSDPSNLVTITAVNEPPTAVGDSFSTAEDTPLTITSASVLANDADPDSPATLAAFLVPGPSSVTQNADGSFVFTPAANFSGEVSFTYKAVATYGAGATVDSNVATVTITVTPVNDAPVAAGQSLTTLEDTFKGITLTASDVDGDALTYAVTTQPRYGTLSGTAPNLTYTPAPNFYGSDSFAFVVSDGTATGAATVSLTVTSVNDPPTATKDSYSVTQGTALTVAAPGVLSNDTDSDSTLTATVVTGPSNGTLALASNGSFTYTPTATFFGTVSFTYSASDGVASSVATAVTITVNQLVYGFVNVQNLPPPSTKTFNVGSAVPLAWRFTVNGTAYNSVSARPLLTILRANNTVVYSGTPTDSGSSSFQPPTASNGYTWQFNWQTKGLAATTYYVYVKSEQTDQTFPNTVVPPGGGYPVKLK